MDEGNGDLSHLDDKNRMKMDSSSQETTHTDDIPTHPAVLSVFRTDNILEEICSHLEFNDLKQFRLVSRICNEEARRALIKLDRHWVVVTASNDDEQQLLELDQVLRKLEKTASAGGEDSNQKLLGWIFQRVELDDWINDLGRDYFFRLSTIYGHYLKKIHLNTMDDVSNEGFSVYCVINTMHYLLSVCCPNLVEMVVDTVFLDDDANLYNFNFFGLRLGNLEFSSPLLKLKCLRIRFSASRYFHDQEIDVGQGFLAKLVIGAGSALQKLDIDYGFPEEELEETMLNSISLNVDDSNFQSLQEVTLISAANVSNLSHTVQKCFPKLTKLILRNFDSEVIHDRITDALADPAKYQVFPESFPALKSLTIQKITYDYITNGKVFYFLQHFPNLEVLNVSASSNTDEWPEIPDPVAPRPQSLRCFTFKTEDYDLCLLRSIVRHFPNIVRLNLLKFGRGGGDNVREPEYSFGELINTISPLTRLRRLEVNHAFHTSPQLVDALQLTSNLAAVDTLFLSQAAHDYTEQDFNVSLYLKSADPNCQYILEDFDITTRLGSVELLDFRVL